MVGMNPVGPSAEVLVQQWTNGASQDPAPTTRLAPPKDEVKLSRDARDAAAAQKALAESEAREKVRKQQLEQTRKRMEEGLYRLQQVVVQVASVVAHYVDDKTAQSN